MKPTIFDTLFEEIQDDYGHCVQFYHPFSTASSSSYTRQFVPNPEKAVFSKLLILRDQQNSVDPHFDQTIHEKSVDLSISQDKYLKKILLKPQQQKSLFIKPQSILQDEPFSFNYDAKNSYSETPGFKSLLRTPLRFFSLNFSFEMQELQSANHSQQKFKCLAKNQNPCHFFGEAAAYFVGIAMNFIKQNKKYEPLFFLNLACYLEPFNYKVWDQIISFLKKLGFWNKAYIYAKTAFLFKPNMIFAEEYLMCGDKAQVPVHELRGLVSSLKYPEKYEKVILQSAKCQIKYRKTWRGLLLLNKICSLSNYRPSLSYGVITLAKCLQNIEMERVALKILEKSIERGMSKFEAYFTYIEIKLRVNNGKLNEKQISFLESRIDNLTVQTRYRLALCLAEVLIKNRNKRYEQFILKSFKLANKFCKGVGKERAMRQIYYSLISAFNISPAQKHLHLFKSDEQLIFMSNRKKFIRGDKMDRYQFQNWKYYLHLALLKDSKLLIKAFQQFNQGRLIAEAIHILREKQSPLRMLSFWRKKIEQVPKSGQLWCEGSRIYTNLGQYQNAAKCLENAIHFTPQFGDSFIELLKIYLRISDFDSIERLKKKFLLSEPYYGNVLSFLQLSYYYQVKIKASLKNVWDQAMKVIKVSLYSNKLRLECSLTACHSYNEALKNPSSEQTRQILFSSYQQMQNRISKT